MASNSECRTIPIGGIRVHFPFKPYPSQLSMMAKIIAGLERKHNCLLESPTGTGKSLALLCSSVAWLDAHKAKLDKEAGEKKLELPEEMDPTRTCSCKCHLTRPKTEEIPETKTDEVVTESRETVEVKLEIPNALKSVEAASTSSQEIDDDDDDFKPSDRSFRTPTTQKPRSHLSIKYEDSPAQESSKQSDSGALNDVNAESSGTWKVETKREPSKDCTAEGNVAPNQIVDCGKCNCAQVISYYMEQMKESVKYPTIYYGTRTHRQLSQITKELARTGYRRTKMTLLAAKRHTCIHDRISQSKDVNEGCRGLLDGSGCTFQEKARSVNQTMVGQCGLEDAWDLEDLLGLCREVGACPYYAARELRTDADIIFCPYNYLIDPNIRASMEINLEGDVVILDEAHNIEDAARSAASYEVSDKQIQNAMTEMDTLMSMNRSLADFVALKNMCMKILDVIDQTKSSMQPTNFDTTSRTYSGREIVIMLEKIGCTVEGLKKMKSHFSNTIAEADEHMATKKMKLSMANQSVLKGFFQVLDYIYKEDSKYLIDYRLAVTRSTTYSQIQGTDTWLNARRGKKNVTHTFSLNLWCMNPAVAFSDFSVARSVILTSGTLAPIQSFQSELGIPFPIQLEANHVISNNQVWVGVVGSGPKNKPIVASYQNTETLEFQDEVGKVILDTCKVIPHGVLCFVSSYKMLEKLRTRWLDTGLWQQMERIKGVYSEPRGSDPSQFEEVVKEYYADVASSESAHSVANGGITGALLFAVCRGKLSEGIDFSNNKARAVIVLGIPYPNVKDTLVNLKRDYNNMHHQKRGLLSGSHWYEIQAFRALNQALGRCIRHRNDWGALILLDDRFSKSEKYTKGLSKWIRNRVQHFRNYNETKDSLECFAETRKNAPVEVPATPSQQMDVSLFSPSTSTPAVGTPQVGTSASRIHDKIPDLASTPKATGSSSTLARKLSDIMKMKSAVKSSTLTESLKVNEEVQKTEQPVQSKTNSAKKGIIYIDWEDDDQQAAKSEEAKEKDHPEATEKPKVGRISPVDCNEADQRTTSPLLFDSESVDCDAEKPGDEEERVHDKTFEYEMEICGKGEKKNGDGAGNLNAGDTDENDNVDKEGMVDDNVDMEGKPNLRRSAKKKAPFSSIKSKVENKVTKEKSSKRGTDSLFDKGETSGLNIRRSKRRKVSNTKYSKTEFETNIEDSEELGIETENEKIRDLNCPFCGEKLISGDEVKEIGEDDYPELIDDLFSSDSSQVYQLKLGSIPETIKLMPPGEETQHLNSHYCEQDRCCVKLYGCRNCDEGDYDKKFPLEPVGFVIKMCESKKTSWKKDTVWLVV